MLAGTFLSWEVHGGSHVPPPTVSPALHEGMEVGTAPAADGCLTLSSPALRSSLQTEDQDVRSEAWQELLTVTWEQLRPTSLFH